MDSTKKYDNPSPEETANILSKRFFCWPLPFFIRGYKNDLEIKDLYNTTKDDLSGPLGDRIAEEWEKELERAQQGSKKPSLKRAIAKTFIKSCSVCGFFLLIQAIGIRMAQPIVLAAFIRYFQTLPLENRSNIEGWLLACGVVLLAFFNIFISHNANLAMQRIGMRCRIACCSLIYRKLLKLNKTALGEVTIGELVNLLSNDVQRFDAVSLYLNYIWLMPIVGVVSFYVMYTSVGLAAIAGFTVILIQSVFLQSYLSKIQGVYRFKIAQKTDGRVKLMNEITASIKVIKMYAWEKPFERMVQLARRYEIDLITKCSYIRGISMAMSVFTERATLYATVIAYILLEHRLSGDIVFSMGQLYNTVQLYICIFFPLGTSLYAEARTSIRRIETFLTRSERDSVSSTVQPSGSGIGGVRLAGASASWLPHPIVDTLIELDMEVPPGMLCCIVGPVGAGKSSLLQLLLGELAVSEGKISVGGRVGYASQEPWLFSSNVRNNILFGREFEKVRYKDVVRVCALERDFELLPYGDKTSVGEKGGALSGGQKARVNLARAVYGNADIYLLDDPLSAVDAHVGRQLFEECILKYLKGKTRILVTHQLQFLKKADFIVVLNNGRIEAKGTFDELSDNILEHIKEEQENEKNIAEDTMEVRERLKSISSIESGQPDDEDGHEPQETEELMEKGAMSSTVYLEYFKSGGTIAFLTFMVLAFILAQTSCNASDLFITYWTNREKSLDNNDFNNSNTTDETSINQNLYITIYTVLIALGIILTCLRSVIFYKVCMNASKRLHDWMFTNLLQATMRFFDTNPSGRILNRFSKDMGIMDEFLPRAILQAVQIFLVLAGILIMIFIVTPWMMIPTLILGVLFTYIRNIFLATAQDVKRLEGITRAPVFSHVSSSLYGLPTIRSSNAEKLITQEFDTLQNQHTASWYLHLALSETFGFYLDIISVIFLAILVFLLFLADDGTTPSGSVGLVISQALILTGMLQFGVIQTTETVANITSVERILQYTKLEKEGPFGTPAALLPPPTWPVKGDIIFQGVSLRYAEGEPPVLKNMNIEIGAGEKIGVVGRTGAGKSSLVAALFRLSPSIEGAIEIDGVDVLKIGLDDLRRKISVIPQEPVLFSATLRYNLDPFKNCDDDTLWKALEKVELRKNIDKLDQMVTEGGANFSAGQRQLICLARAIVRNNKILVMDEATANVDTKTDSLIQKSIRENFKDCTVLTVAHRLNTIMDSDKVLVMEAGEAVEFDRPHLLLKKKNGYFTGMVKETGEAMEAKLREMARDHYFSRFATDD